ncbi:MAG TPA: cytochrome c-type biogenesis protein [Steroidobacteraceae bacterium]|jgi:cytochrome c-type biogenesis protein CcmH|nr:cytochrome c-type biogenesis protein [Steroidobacteraceae bacterium]
MRRAALWIAIAFAMGGVTLAYGIDPTFIDDPALEARYLELTHELRCMQCQNESIADSPVGLASDLRREVRTMVLAGKTDEDVRNYMVSRYGEFILFRPRFSARNAWLWLAPPLFLLIGLIVAVRVVRQRGKLAGSDPDVLNDDGLA